MVHSQVNIYLIFINALKFMVHKIRMENVYGVVNYMVCLP
jgi:hypothetical protein